MEEFAASEKIQEKLHLQRDRAKVYKGLGRKVASAWKVYLPYTEHTYVRIHIDMGLGRKVASAWKV
jgi:hypothetical protein